MAHEAVAVAAIPATSKKPVGRTAKFVVPLACATAACVTQLANHAFGPFLGPISKEFGWGMSTLATGFFISRIINAILGPIAGSLADRYDPRWIVTIAITFFGLSWIGMALMTGGVMQMIVLYALTGASYTFAGTIPLTRVVVGWASERRGLYIGLTMGVGAGLGSLLSPLVSHFLIEGHGWRAAFVMLGVLVLAIGVPSALLLKQGHAGAQRRREDEAGRSGVSRFEVFGSREFWLICASQVCVAAGAGGFSFHAVPILSAFGHSASFGALALSVLSLSSMVGRPLMGHIADKFSGPRIAVPVYFLTFIGLLIVHRGPDSTTLVGVALMGLAVGSEQLFMAYFTERYFGMGRYGEIFGCFMSVSTVSFGLGAEILGRLHDRSGGYDSGLLVIEALMLLGTVLIMFLGKYKFER